MKNFLLAVLILFIIYAVVKAFDQVEETKKKQAAESCISVDMKSWNISGFGTVGMFDVVITNKCPFSVKDIVLEAKYSSNSGTDLGKSRKVTLYETIKGNSKKRFKEVNMGFISNSQASKASIYAVDHN